jgi:hypothetical protein
LDTFVRKLREAEADMSRVADSDLGEPQSFRQALSAFLASSRAAENILRRQAKKRFAAWERSLGPEDVELRDVLLDARDLETYEDGPALGVTIHVGQPPVEARRHFLHLDAPDGTQRKVAVVDACVRRLRLLREALESLKSGVA